MSEDLEKNLYELFFLLERYRMPFGKFGPRNFPPGGLPVYELPYEYLRYFERNGYPAGKLGRLMKFVHDIKRDGAEQVFRPLREKNGPVSLRVPKTGKSFD